MFINLLVIFFKKFINKLLNNTISDSYQTITFVKLFFLKKYYFRACNYLHPATIFLQLKNYIINFFQKIIQKSTIKFCVSCLNIWKFIQEFRKLLAKFLLNSVCREKCWHLLNMFITILLFISPVCYLIRTSFCSDLDQYKHLVVMWPIFKVFLPQIDIFLHFFVLHKHQCMTPISGTTQNNTAVRILKSVVKLIF